MTDWSNPCAALAALRAAKMELLSGEAVARVRMPDREVEFRAASIDKLDAEITRLEGECAKATTGSRRRFALTGGYPGRSW
jgi:hypothetical protein